MVGPSGRPGDDVVDGQAPRLEVGLAAGSFASGAVALLLAVVFFFFIGAL